MPIIPFKEDGERPPLALGVSPAADMLHTPHRPYSPDNLAEKRRSLPPPTNPTQFTNFQELGGNQTPRMQQLQQGMDGGTLQPQQNQFSPEHIDQPTEETNAVGPDRELTSQAEWKQWIESSIEEFIGNEDNAATLMSAFNDGKSYVYEKLSERGLKSLVRPATKIVPDSSTASIFSEGNKGQDVNVKKPHLEVFSAFFDMETIHTIKRPDGTVGFKGRIPDLFGLAGIEETHHAAFEQVKGDVPAGIDPNSTTTAEYDAREIEYSALKWQLRYAEERHMPEETTNFLSERLEAARDVRAKRQK